MPASVPHLYIYDFADLYGGIQVVNEAYVRIISWAFDYVCWNSFLYAVVDICRISITEVYVVSTKVPHVEPSFSERG